MNQLPKVASYDLTTQDGMATALEVYARGNPAKALMMAAFPMISLPTMLSAAFGNKIHKSVSALFEHPEKMIEAQRKTAVDIIKAGKENGASKVRVTLNQKAGIDIGGALEGYSLKFSVGTDDQMTIETEYK